MYFEPIAIVGQGCALPGALSPEALWAAVVEGRDLVSRAPEGAWRVAPEHILTTEDTPKAGRAERAWSDRGGYVRGFEEVFEPQGFEIPASEVLEEGPLIQWCLHAGRQALQGLELPDRSRAGLILGNLSYPSAAMAAYAERVWLGEARAEAAGVPRAQAHERFMSGLSAHRVAHALGLKGASWALDAACASSLYALSQACERLQDGQADLMLAGAVTAADDLFIHVGFSALKALSQSGQSRPFHAGADGLVPAQGAGLVALKRLEDAEAAGDAIAGVIRGIGLSNDGRGRGFLAPSSPRQVVAMRRAYSVSGLRPQDISLVECHATGTVVGDGAEIASMSEVFEGLDGLPVGSLKSNLGHLICAAGVAGLLKLLGALRTRTRPPTLHTENPHEALKISPLRLLTEAEPWPSEGPRRAALSAFGFGGNNAHLILEEHVATEGSEPPRAELASPAIAIVGLAARIGDAKSSADLEAALFSAQAPHEGQMEEIKVRLKGLRFPPADLAQSLPQQLLLLETARDAADQTTLPRETTGALIGMGTDPNIARYGGRWRLPQWAERWGEGDRWWMTAARDAFTAPLGSAGVVGAMPNIVANRLNSQLDLGGASLAICSEELSGVRALELAVRALRAGDLDAALVGAVDMSSEPVHRAAAQEMKLPEDHADGAVVLVLKRLDDAIDQGDRVLALVGQPSQDQRELAPLPVAKRWGSAHAASGLLEVAAGVLCCARGRAPGGDLWPGKRALEISLEALGGQETRVWLRSLSEDRVAAPGNEPSSGEEDLTFPAHQEQVLLPEGSSKVHGPRAQPTPSSTRSPEVQIMARAPRLASTLVGSPSFALTEPLSAPAPLMGSLAQSAKAGPLGEAHGRLQEVHQAFVTQVSEAHERFLLGQMEASRVLLRATGVLGRAGTEQAHPEAPLAAQRPPQTPPHEAPRPEGLGAPSSRTTPKMDPPLALPGPTFNRGELESLARGKISALFGPLFEAQDAYPVQVRMPEPPLLLCDRVLGIDAEPAKLGPGTIWTQTDIVGDAWYLHEDRMGAGFMIESGQADLLLISWMGIDLLNRGERSYRLLGCELTYHGGLPRVGDTLSYEIAIDGHASHGDVRLFFFHYDCQVDGAPRLSVREGQAGFFTREELDDSAGILWTPEEGERTQAPRLDPARLPATRAQLSQAQLEAFAAGDVFGCFGAGYELAQTHTRSPRIAEGPLLLLQEVTHLERSGGPWGRGYLRATWDFEPDDWFFEGHFKGDPCMPGTLMFEGCLQAMAIFMTEQGFTLDRDGWIFEPVPEVAYQLRCRGQATPESKLLEIEVFVDELMDGERPTLFADILCTVDGRKAFHCRRMGLQLTPAWPLDSKSALVADLEEDPRAASVDGFTFDYQALLASAWGPPSEAFGPMYAPFDGPKRVARLPGPPYHFMSRVTEVRGPIGVMKAGAEVELEYDIPQDAWYFEQASSMPYCVLLEAALQPCGWLASYVGSALTSEGELFFRNLGGTATLHEELRPSSGTLRTRVKLTSVSSSGGMIIENFQVTCFLGARLVYEVDTVFGFFPGAALENQKGLPIEEEHRALLTKTGGEGVKLRAHPAPYFSQGASLPTGQLLMIDELDGWWPGEGAAGLGQLRSTAAVRPEAWYFKAHFFQDPVQPGSLGLEAMIQLLQIGMLKLGMDEGMKAPRFEPIQLGEAMTWLYRGQVIPADEQVFVTMELTERGESEGGPWLRADASLWVDGRRIYEAQGMTMGLVDGGPS